MSFGKWDNFDACTIDMMGAPHNYTAEEAKRVCGKLQERLEGKQVFKMLRASGNRRVVAQYVHVEGIDAENDILPNHRLKEALEELKSRDPRYQNVMWWHSSYQIGYPLWNFTDVYGVHHKTEVDEYGLWGITEIRNDGFLKADEVWKDILKGEPMGASVGVTSSDGSALVPIKLSKGELAKRGLPSSYLGGKYYDQPLSFIEPWSLTTAPVNRNVTTVTVLAKGICEPCVEVRADWYLKRGVCKNKEDALYRARRFYEQRARKQKQVEMPSQLYNISSVDLKKRAEEIIAKHFPKS